MPVNDYAQPTGQQFASNDELDGILAAIPAFNEQKTIGSVVLSARRYATKVIVVDDGSEDQTAWIAEQAGATVIQHPVNRGYGAAIRSCFDYARRIDVGVLVILDGDGQHRAEMIPRMVAPVKQGRADICIGSRFLNLRSSRRVPRYRRLGIRMLTRLANLGTRSNAKMSDAQSGLRAYSRAAIETINPMEDGMGAGTEILWDADKHGLRILEVPVDVDYEAGHSGKSPVQHGLRVMASMLRYVETEHPFLFFGPTGLAIFLGGAALGAVVLDSYSRTGLLAVGLSLITVMLVVLGVLIMLTGLILHAMISVVSRSR